MLLILSKNESTTAALAYGGFLRIAIGASIIAGIIPNIVGSVNAFPPFSTRKRPGVDNATLRNDAPALLPDIP
jgi:hypothetical protein